MKMKIGSLVFNTNTCIKHKDSIKTTTDQINQRVYVVKEEVLYHQKHNHNNFFNLVTVTKFIDDKPVSSYSWIQDVDKEELTSFLEQEELTKQNKRKEYVKQYYSSHKDYYKQYYSQKKQQETDKEQLKQIREQKRKEYIKQYQLTHLEQYRKYCKKYRNKLKELKTN